MQRFADSVRSRSVLRLAGWLGLLALVIPTVATAMPVVISTTASTNGPLARTEWIVQAGPSPIDTFRMTRLARDVPAHDLKGALLLLPALGSSFVQYEQRAPHGGFGSAIAEFFAVRGYDVWGYSPRYEGIPAGTCEAGAVDCTSMAGWTIQSMVDDIGFVRDQIELLNPGTQVVAGGFSLGAILSIAVANDDPTRYAGIIPWEGMLESPDAGVQALNAGYCAALEAQLMAGLSYDGVSNNVLKMIVQNASASPDALNTVPLLPPFLTNRQALVGGLVTPAPGPFSMPVPGYVAAAGDPVTATLFHASEARVLDNVLGSFASYVPLATVRDLSCGLAGLDDSHTNALDLFTGSVLMIGGGQAFGAYMQDQLDAFTSAADRELRLEPGFGHVDHAFNRFRRHFVDRPILNWLRQVL